MIEAIYQGTFKRDGVLRIVQAVTPLANGERRVLYNEWDMNVRGLIGPTENTVADEEWKRWVTWADRDDEAPRCSPPWFVDCPNCAYRVEREKGFAPGDRVGCPKCVQAFSVVVEAVAKGVIE